MTATKTKGLGKGLSALFAEDEMNSVLASQSSKNEGLRFVEILVDQISPARDQPRKSFDETEIKSLSESIIEKGVIQPILVRPIAENGKARFQIIAGERRWRAAKLAGLDNIPAIIRDINDIEALEVAVIENIQRQDLTMLEEAAAYKRLIDEFDYTQETVAARVGKSRSHIANLIRLLALPDEVKKMMNKGELTMGHARALLAASDPLAAAKKIKSEKLTVRDVENMARKEKTGEKFSVPHANTNTNSLVDRKRDRYISDGEVADIERTIAEEIGLTVTINNYGKRGELIIQYQSLEQLDLLIQRICR